jgi:hypothetical protein
MANRKMKRAAAANARKNNPARVIPEGTTGKAARKGPADFSKGRALNAVMRGADAAASDAKNAVGVARALVLAAEKGEIKSKDAKEYLLRVRAETIKRRAKAWSLTLAEAAKQTAPVIASRASDIASIIKLAPWQCTDALWTSLADFDDLSERRIVDVSRAMRGKKGKAGWPKENTDAPPREWLARVIKAGKVKPSSDSASNGGVFGMSVKPLEGMDHIIKSLKLFNKKNGALLAPNARKVVTQAIDGCAGLLPVIKAALKAKEKATAAAAT